jgi:hypothetical protein
VKTLGNAATKFGECLSAASAASTTAATAKQAYAT